MKRAGPVKRCGRAPSVTSGGLALLASASSWVLIAAAFTVAACALAMPLLAFASPTGLADTDGFVREGSAMLQTMELTLETAARDAGYTDRHLHFWVSVPAGAFGAHLATLAFPERGPVWMPLVLGTGVGLVPGLIKELMDMQQPDNYFSWTDLGYDALGSLTGALLVWGIHRLVERRQRARQGWD